MNNRANFAQLSVNSSKVSVMNVRCPFSIKFEQDVQNVHQLQQHKIKVCYHCEDIEFFLRDCFYWCTLHAPNSGPCKSTSQTTSQAVRPSWQKSYSKLTHRLINHVMSNIHSNSPHLAQVLRCGLINLFFRI